MAADAGDKLSKLEQQQKELAEKIKREKAKLRRAEREREQRRAAVLGALVLKHYEDAPEIKAWIDRLLEEKLDEANERVLFGLAPKAEPETGA
jgi:hypothetical protein